MTLPTTGVVPGPASLTLTPLIVAGSMSSLKVAAMRVLRGTSCAPLAGWVNVTVGRVKSAVAAVRKVQTKPAARALPARSVAAVLIVAVIWLSAGSVSGVVGVKVTDLAPST